VFKSTLRQYFI